MAARGGARLQLQLQLQLQYNYNYNYNYKNLKSYNITLNCELDGGARWRKVTLTVTIILSLGLIFKRIE